MPQQIPSTEALRHARQALAGEATANALANRITDPIITPFVRALIAEGFTIEKGVGGRCDALRTCPACQSRYLYTALRAGVAHRVCPHCRAASDRAAEREATGKALMAGAARAAG